MDARAIQEAVINGKLERVRFLLDKGTPTTTRYGMEEYTLLHIAAIRLQTEIMKLLIERGADLNAVTWNGETVLHFAAKQINRPATELLLDFGMDVNRADNRGYTPLHNAARYSHSDTIALLLEHGADTHAKTTDHGDTPLHRVWNWNLPTCTQKAALLLAVSPETANILNNDGEIPQLNNHVGLQAAIIDAIPSAVAILAARRRLPAMAAWKRRAAERQARYAAHMAASASASASGSGSGSNNSFVPAIITMNKTPSQRAYDAAIRRRNESKGTSNASSVSGSPRRRKTRSRKQGKKRMSRKQ